MNRHGIDNLANGCLVAQAVSTFDGYGAPSPDTILNCTVGETDNLEDATAAQVTATATLHADGRFCNDLDGVMGRQHPMGLAVLLVVTPSPIVVTVYPVKRDGLISQFTAP